MIRLAGGAARLAGLALDARARPVHPPARERAVASQWIAGNAIAIRGRRLFACGAVPVEASVVAIQIGDLGELFAALAVMPSLIEPTQIPARWRFALRALGVPVLTELPHVAIGAGVSVLTVAPLASWKLAIERQPIGYVARMTRTPALLAA